MTELPTTFGKYYLTEKLATGGMAEIYLAKLIGPGGFEKQLVIKQIHPRLSGQRHFVDLFVAEAKTLVTLAHGNIVPVYELGVVDDTYFIAMEYIDGPTLYRLTERMAGRDAVMEPAVAAWITARILEGLDYAHRKGEGVIHRDLSPRNVMLSRDGEVKLVDFGIAVTLGEPATATRAQSAPTGSFPYMSPEQVRREPLTGQTDLFSVGVLCWEMLVGQRLFARTDADATLDAVARGEIPRPSARAPRGAGEARRGRDARARARPRPRAGRPRATCSPRSTAISTALDETPGPRDVAALVARYCPPETRRLPTHLETDRRGRRQRTRAPARATAVIPRAESPSTAVIPRDAQPKGKRPQRAADVRDERRAQGHPQRATPLFPIEAIRERAAARPTTSRATTRRRARIAEETAADRRGMVAPPIADAAAASRRARVLLVLMGFGGLALAGRRGLRVLPGPRRRSCGRDAARRRAGRCRDVDRADRRRDATRRRARCARSMPLGADLDAAPARRRRARSTMTRARAARRVRRSPTRCAPRARATLTIGADPWGEIYVDGKSYGQHAARDRVAAGHHTVEIVFPAVSPPRKQTFAVDLATGETKPLQADFH